MSFFVGTIGGTVDERNKAQKEIERLKSIKKELLEAFEYLLKQCEENERNNTNYMGVSEFAKERASNAIQKAKGEKQ